MGLVARLIAFAHVVRGASETNVSEATVDKSGGDNIIADHFDGPGEDASPMPGDYAAMLPIQRSGAAVAVGYVDPLNEPQTGPGEKRIYSRDEDGVAIAQVFLKKDGTILLSNPIGSTTMLPDGNTEIKNENGTVTLAPDGTITLKNNNGTVTLAEDGGSTLKNDNGSMKLGADGFIALANAIASFDLAVSGGITGSNAGGSFALNSSGSFLVNGVIIDAAGNVVIPLSLILGGKEINLHAHLANNPPGETGPNI